MNTTATPRAEAKSAQAPLVEPAAFHWLRGEIDHLFEEIGQPARELFNLPTRLAGPAPAIELADGGDSYWLTVETPGLTDKDVTIELADGVLTIAGEKSREEERREDGRLISERRYGSFTRHVTLPTDADAEAIKAKCKHGILTVHIGKDRKAAPRSRRIKVEG